MEFSNSNLLRISSSDAQRLLREMGIPALEYAHLDRFPLLEMVRTKITALSVILKKTLGDVVDVQVDVLEKTQADLERMKKLVDYFVLLDETRRRDKSPERNSK